MQDVGRQDTMTQRYENCTDEELIERLRDGEEQIMEYLMDKYKNLVRSKAKSMYILGGDTQDLIQEGMIGLFKAIRDYDSGRDASFFTFAQLCVSRNIYSAVQRRYPLHRDHHRCAKAAGSPPQRKGCQVYPGKTPSGAGVSGNMHRSCPCPETGVGGQAPDPG